MKKICVLALCFLAFHCAFAQVPSQFSYQAVARNKDGTPLSKGSKITVKFSVPNTDFSETHPNIEINNDFGLFNLKIGSIKKTLDKDVDWKKANNLKVEITDTSGDTKTFEEPLLTVPYAFVAQKVVEGGGMGPTYQAGTGIDIQNNTISIKSGIIPTALPPNGVAEQDLRGTYPKPFVSGLQGRLISTIAPTDSQVLKWINNAWTPARDEKGTGGGVEIWTPVGNNINRVTGNVGIGVNPTALLHLAKGNLIMNDGEIKIKNASGFETVNINGSDPDAAAPNGVIFLRNNVGENRAVLGVLNNNTGGYIDIRDNKGSGSDIKAQMYVRNNAAYLQLNNKSNKPMFVISNNITVNGDYGLLALRDPVGKERVTISLEDNDNKTGTVGTVYADRFLTPDRLVDILILKNTSVTPNKNEGYVVADHLQSRGEAQLGGVILRTENNNSTISSNDIICTRLGRFANYKVEIKEENGKGNVYANGMILTSDRNLKKNITNLDKILPKLMLLAPSSYQFLSQTNNDRSIGFVAQDIQKYFPELVHKIPQKDGESVLGLEYSGFSVLAIKAIQEQQQQIEALKSENSHLKKEMDSLKADISDIKKLLNQGKTPTQN